MLELVKVGKILDFLLGDMLFDGIGGGVEENLVSINK